MAPGDARLGEMARLRNRLIELDATLKEERKVSARLRDQSEKKSEQLAIVDAEIAAETERFRWKKEEVLFAIRNNERDAKGRIALMKYDERKLLEDLAESDLVQFHNERLHVRLKEISSEHMQSSASYVAEREARKQKGFDTRMEMEEMLRKMIKNVDEGLQLEAVAKMQKEASQANIENDRIHTEFSIREAKTEALIRQQQVSYEQLMRTKIERDVMALSTEVQEKNIAKMTRINEINDIRLREQARHVQRLQDDVTALSVALFSKQEVDERCKETLALIAAQEAEAQQWRAATLRLCRKLLHECSAIAEKGRVHGNARLTQQLDQLTSTAEEVLLQEDERSAASREESEDEASVRTAQDYEAVWRCPQAEDLRLSRPTDWRRARAKQPAPVSNMYRSFSM